MVPRVRKKKNGKEDWVDVQCVVCITERACPFKHVRLSDGRSKHPWVGVTQHVPVSLVARHCSGVTWLPCAHTVSHTADFTGSHPLFLAYASSRRSVALLSLPPPPPHPSIFLHSLVSYHVFFRFPVCRPPFLAALIHLILEPIDLQSEWASRPRVDSLQCDLGACEPSGEGG